MSNAILALTFALLAAGLGAQCIHNAAQSRRVAVVSGDNEHV